MKQLAKMCKTCEFKDECDNKKFEAVAAVQLQANLSPILECNSLEQSYNHTSLPIENMFDIGKIINEQMQNKAGILKINIK